MSELSILEGSRPLKKDLEVVTMERLELEETLQLLFSGEVILLSTYENDSKKDIIVRIKETKNGMVTQISKPSPQMAGFVGGKKYWSLYDVSINMLSMYPTYNYDETRYGLGYKFEPNTIVEYKSDYGDIDVATIDEIMVSEEGDYYYTISGEGDKVFMEDELKEIKK